MQDNSRDLYAALGVSRTASADEIRKAFKKLARANHPDHNPDNPEAESRFKEVNEAYQVLSDEKKRGLYDRYGHEGLREGFDPNMYEQARRGGFGGGGFGSGFGSGGFSSGGFGGGGFEDIRFEDLFSGFGSGRRGQRAPREQRLGMRLTFKEALEGTSKTLSHTRQRACSACKGTGMLSSSSCGVCGGTGRIREEQSFEVKIPQGAATGDKLRLRGRGDADASGQAADILLDLTVADDPRFSRDGLHLIGRVRVTPLDLILGKTLAIEGPWGPLKMKLAAGADPKKSLRAAGRGVKRKGEQGDFLVELEIVPLSLTAAQREALESLREEIEPK